MRSFLLALRTASSGAFKCGGLRGLFRALWNALKCGGLRTLSSPARAHCLDILWQLGPDVAIHPQLLGHRCLEQCALARAARESCLLVRVRWARGAAGPARLGAARSGAARSGAARSGSAAGFAAGAARSAAKCRKNSF
jgi:hypothetical protein